MAGGGGRRRGPGRRFAAAAGAGLVVAAALAVGVAWRARSADPAPVSAVPAVARDVLSSVGALRPAGAGWPDADTTGPTDPAALAPHGDLVITEDGAIISDLDITGTVIIEADDVTLRNVRVTARTAGEVLVNVGYGHSGVVIEDCELNGRGLVYRGVGFDGYTLRRCDIHDLGHGAVTERHVVVEDNWIHDLSEGTDGLWHTDGVIMSIGTDVVLRGNNISVPLTQTSAIGLWAELGDIDGVLVEDNLLSGGGYVLYAQEVGFAMTEVRFVGNRISRRDWPEGTNGGPGGGHWGVWYPAAVSGVARVGTVWHDTGEPVPDS